VIGLGGAEFRLPLLIGLCGDPRGGAAALPAELKNIPVQLMISFPFQ